MTNRTLVTIVLAVLTAAMSAAAQNYGIWSPAANLGSGINSSSAEGCPFIAKDDLSLFVVTTRADGFGGQDIYVSERDSALDPWGPLQNLGPTVNSAANELCPALAPGGHQLFFVSDRSGGCGKQDLYVAWRQNKRDDFGWVGAENLGCDVNSADNDFTPTLFEDETARRTMLYFGSDRAGGAGSVDLYESSAGDDGTFRSVLPISELNTAFADERPNVRRDGLELFFDSNRPGTLGATDLWVATRDSTDAPWSSPLNLGAAINTSAAETRPSLSFDGTSLYFGSGRLGGFGSSDIYTATRPKNGSSR